MGAEEHGLLRVVMAHDVAGTVQRNVFHVASAIGYFTPELARQATEVFRTWWEVGSLRAPPPRVFTGEATSLISVVSRFIPAPTVIKQIVFLGGTLGVFGPAGAQSLPANATFAIEWLTGYQGRSGHGRSYLCGLSKDVLSGSGVKDIDAAFVPSLILSYDDLWRQMFTVGDTEGLFRLCVFHRQGFLKSDGTSKWFTPITGVRVSDVKLDSQRGRLPGHVHH